MEQSTTPSPSILTRLALLAPGMYTFRYATPLPADQAAPITLQAAPLGRGAVDFFPAEGIVKNTLRQLGDCIVVRVKTHEAAVLLAEFRGAPPGSQKDDATACSRVLIDRIDTSERLLERTRAPASAGTPPPKQSPVQATFGAEPPLDPFATLALDPFAPANAPPAPAARGALLHLLGHIERLGDVRITDGWLGNPAGQARIEGFAIDWLQRPDDVDLVYTCRSAGIGQTPAIFSGGFAGTRGKAAPITALALALSGPGASRYNLSGEVVFAGCPPLSIEPGKKLSGPAGSEPLVAMKVLIARNEGEATVSRYPSPWDDPEVTQIFRANS